MPGAGASSALWATLPRPFASLEAMRLRVEIADEDGVRALPELPGGGAAFVAFLSFALARGLGGQHPLTALAEHLRREHRLSLGPFERFYEGVAEDEEDAALLERMWQPAAELREAVGGLAACLRSGDVGRVLAERGAAPALAEEAKALWELLEEPANRGAQVRLSYEL